MRIGPDPASGQAAPPDRLSVLLEDGVRQFLDLTEPGELDPEGVPLVAYEPALRAMASAQGYAVVWRRYAVPEEDVPGLRTMQAILDDIDAALAHSRPVLVHGRTARGRAGVVAGCWLVRHGLADALGATGHLAGLRQASADAGFESPETDFQRQFIGRWRLGL